MLGTGVRTTGKSSDKWWFLHCVSLKPTLLQWVHSDSFREFNLTGEHMANLSRVC
jgi:hypothetical protein